jgi:hypothetical protein
MSIRAFSQQINSPFLVLGSGAAILLSLPAASAFCVTTGVSHIGLLQAANVTAYMINCASVSVPGRIDGQAQDAMEGKASEGDQTYQSVYSPKQGRSLIAPAGWAFAIWGPIYLGEAIFCTSLLLRSCDALTVALPAITAPFVAANLVQSLWCASFRPSYMSINSTWRKYVSVAMLGGTAYSLSLVHTAAAASSWYFLPLTLHYGWTTAATLVNLNGSLAMSDCSDRILIAVGHASALLATTLGVAVTLLQHSPPYGLTIAWALAACADGMKKRRLTQGKHSSDIDRGMKVQQILCYAGSALCASAAFASYIFSSKQIN